jgi:hypothetical protein
LRLKLKKKMHHDTKSLKNGPANTLISWLVTGRNEKGMGSEIGKEATAVAVGTSMTSTNFFTKEPGPF